MRGTVCVSWLLIFLCICNTLVPITRADEIATVSGHVVDRATGIAIAGARVSVVGTKVAVVTSTDGSFTIQTPRAHRFTLLISHDGYQAAETPSLEGTNTTGLLLSLQSQATASQLKLIGHTSVRASDTLQSTSYSYKRLDSDNLEAQGEFRLGDALAFDTPGVNLSSVNGYNFPTSKGQAMFLDIRGIGTLETVTLIDGHKVP